MLISFILIFLIGFTIIALKKSNIKAVLTVGVCVWLFFNLMVEVNIWYCEPETEIKTETVIVYENNLLNLQDTNQSEGKFVGFSYFGTGAAFGRDKEKLYYCFYEETQYGYKFQKLSPEVQEIYLQYINDNEKPKITTECDETTKVRTLKKKPSIWWSSLYDYKKYHKYNVGDIIEENRLKNDYRQVLYIPKGSIVENYKVDME